MRVWAIRGPEYLAVAPHYTHRHTHTHTWIPLLHTHTHQEGHCFQGVWALGGPEFHTHTHIPPRKGTVSRECGLLEAQSVTHIHTHTHTPPQEGHCF